MKTGSRAIIPEPPLLVLPSLAVAVGLPGAMVLQQLHFLSHNRRPDRNGERWVEMGNADLQHTFPFLSKNTLFRAVYKLRDDGLLTIKSAEGVSNRYRLEYEAIDTALVEGTLPKMGHPKMGREPTQDGVGTLPKMGRATTKEVLDSESSINQGGVDKPKQEPPPGPLMTMQWLPSEACQQQLLDAGFGLDFIRKVLPEFRMYWTERGEARPWESAFMAHVRMQHDKRQAAPAPRAPAAPQQNPSYQRNGPPEPTHGRQPDAADVIASFTPKNPLTPEENKARMQKLHKELF